MAKLVAVASRRLLPAMLALGMVLALACGAASALIGTSGGRVGSEAPEFQGIVNWINSEPLTMEQLRGKVVLVDFWTYTCVNCIRTFPFLKENLYIGLRHVSQRLERLPFCVSPSSTARQRINPSTPPTIAVLLKLGLENKASHSPALNWDVLSFIHMPPLYHTHPLNQPLRYPHSILDTLRSIRTIRTGLLPPLSIQLSPT